MTVEKQKDFLIKAAFYVLCAGFILLSLKLLSGVLFPFALAGVLAVALQSLIRDWTRKFKLKKKPAAVCLMLAVYIVFFTVFGVALYAVYRQLIELLGSLPQYFEQIESIVNALGRKLENFFGKMPEMGGMLENVPSATMGSVVERLASSVGSLVTDVATSIPKLLLSLLVTVVASAYLAKDYDEISQYIIRKLPSSVSERLIHLKNTVMKKLVGLLKGYLIIIAITFVELLIGLLILGYKYALIIAAATAFVDILPVLGCGTVLIPWAVISGASGDTKVALGLVVLYLIITAIRNAIEPKIIGQKLGVHPLIMLLAVFLGLRIFGAAGVIVLPVAVVALSEVV